MFLDEKIQTVLKNCIRCHKEMNTGERLGTDENLKAIVNKTMPKNKPLGNDEIAAFKRWADSGYQSK